MTRAALIGLAVAALAGCAGTPPASDSGAVLATPLPVPRERREQAAPMPAVSGVGVQAARVAAGQVGSPYRYGGASPAGFDCSGLVHYAYRQAGKSVPRTTAGQWARLAPVGSGEMRVGDVLFFSIEGKMSHVGLYLGDGRFVHAPQSGRKVEIERLGSDFYRKAFLRAGRPL